MGMEEFMPLLALSRRCYGSRISRGRHGAQRAGGVIDLHQAAAGSMRDTDKHGC
jgi:hypothetical protein